jgi:hypothetical protein
LRIDHGARIRRAIAATAAVASAPRRSPATAHQTMANAGTTRNPVGRTSKSTPSRPPAISTTRRVGRAVRARISSATVSGVASDSLYMRTSNCHTFGCSAAIHAAPMPAAAPNSRRPSRNVRTITSGPSTIACTANTRSGSTPISSYQAPVQTW